MTMSLGDPCAASHCCLTAARTRHASLRNRSEADTPSSAVAGSLGGEKEAYAVDATLTQLDSRPPGAPESPPPRRAQGAGIG